MAAKVMNVQWIDWKYLILQNIIMATMHPQLLKQKKSTRCTRIECFYLITFTYIVSKDDWDWEDISFPNVSLHKCNYLLIVSLFPNFCHYLVENCELFNDIFAGKKGNYTSNLWKPLQYKKRHEIAIEKISNVNDWFHFNFSKRKSV